LARFFTVELGGCELFVAPDGFVLAGDELVVEIFKFGLKQIR
jgi:hypothetical protein